MTLGLLDCPTGLAGNMLLAALLDLGVPQAVVEEPLAALGLAGAYRLELEERRSRGLRGLHLSVISQEPDPPHRRWGELEQRLRAAPLPAPLAERVLAVFGLLAEAEAAVHGEPVERVHFHEVGALDALVDVVGVCAALEHLQLTELICAPPPAGHGSVAAAHGPLPLPVPAVLEIARLRSLPLASSEGFPPGELTTPTGMALVACWATRFGAAPAVVPLRTGVGLGSRQLDRPNLVRFTLAAPFADEGTGRSSSAASSFPAPPAPASAPAPALSRSPAGSSLGSAVKPAEGEPLIRPLLRQQAQIDDATAEDLAFLAEALRQAGAVEVFSQPAAMKKGRLGTLVTALLPPERAEALRRVWWHHSTSLGVREALEQRWELPRRQASVATPLGEVAVKWSQRPGGGWRAKAEAEDLAALARRHGLPLEQVRRQVEQAWQSEAPQSPS